MTPTPETLPLAAARDLLERRLAERAGGAGPQVAALGDSDVLGGQGSVPRARATVHLTSQAVLVGPWGGASDATACGNCLAMRWQRLRSRTEREALETGLGMTAVDGGWPALTGFALDALWSLHQLVAGAASVTAQVSWLDLESLRVRTFPLLPEPLCPHCAAPQGEEPVPALVPRPKAAPDAYRLRTPQSYGLPAEALANPVCGVLGAGTWSDVISPTTAPVAGSVFMRGYAGLTDVTWSGQANAFRNSRELAFLEGLERYAGTHRRSTEPLLVDSYRNLAGGAVDPRACGLYEPGAYQRDPMLSPFDPDRPIPWVRGWSLRDEHPLLVPARLCYYSAGSASDNFVFECSNGCAIGSCLEEAILFGLLELIERDSFLLGWYGGLRPTGIDLASCTAPALRAMVDRAALQGYDVHAFDSRVDLAIPVVTGLAVRRDGGPGTLAFAAGAGFDPQTAVESAVSEILTYLPHLPRQVSERPDELAAMAEDFDLVRRLPDHAALFGLPQMARHAEDYLRPAARRPMDELYAGWLERRPGSADLLDDLRYCRDELVRAGFDVVVVDQTSPEQRRLGLRTVCTLVPGLLPIDFGWSRQRALGMPRLRTAARRGGLRATDLADHELRRVPHPFP